MAGSDVDPYERAGSTRLFIIARLGANFRLSIAPDENSAAPASAGTTYPCTDQGIRQMYLDLAGSPVFSKVKYCYVPGRIGADLDSERGVGLQNGYDPATGLRAVVLGSAVSQVVPLDDFIKTRNEQIYNPSPVIVPLVTALVYDITQHNALGATTFTLPTVYTRDRIGADTDYVSKLGQTALFPGGPGYDDAAATALQLKSVGTVTLPDHSFLTYTFDTAKAYATSELGSRVETGVAELTCQSASPARAFASQRFIGFYRDNAWTTCLGVPIWDYGTENAGFTAVTAAPAAPVTVYDPAHGVLNGGSLRNVVGQLRRASYLYEPDVLAEMLDSAARSQPGNGGGGLAATAAALDFNLSGRAASTPIVDQLEVPVVVTVTTTPDPVVLPGRDAGRPGAAVGGPAAHGHGAAGQGSVIGSVANALKGAAPGPVTIQAGLTASIPREALDRTGISSLESGTPFREHALGDAGTFQALTAGRVLNLTERGDGPPALPPQDLELAGLQVKFRSGILYVLALADRTLSVRGTDGSQVSVPAKARDATHEFVGAMVYTTAMASVRLYPKLQLALAAPTVGTNGILQGQAYSVRLTYGEKTSSCDFLDASQTPVASKVSVPSPAPADKSAPRPGDMYFGSFTGGDATMTVWSVPVFLTVAPADLPGAGTSGTMALDAQVSGVPAYRLQITDSSLFVFTNINLDTQDTGSVSTASAFLAAAVINSSPDDLSARAFAPCRVLLGLVRPVLVGSTLKFVFVPADDSIVIGATRYMVSVIEIEALGFDPARRPYPPTAWLASRYWQFANKHNPYLDVRYAGATQDARRAQAEEDTDKIGADEMRRREPVHLYLDTDGDLMTLWPTFGFPFDSLAQTVDTGKLQTLADSVLELIASAPVAPADSGSPGAERISVPEELRKANPYDAGPAPAAATAAGIAQEAIEPTAVGRVVTNLSPGAVAPPLVSSSQQLLSASTHAAQRVAAALTVTKELNPPVAVLQDRLSTAGEPAAVVRQQRKVIYGFSAYNARTGEAYLVELVPADQDVFDQLPDPKENRTYDPYYVRVLFLNALTCYNMSIIVPAMVHDQYGHFAREGTPYANLLSKTNELTLGYLYPRSDAQGRFDDLTFRRYAPPPRAMLAQQAVFTNVPYSIQTAAPADTPGTAGTLTTARTATSSAAATVGAGGSAAELAVFHQPTTFFACRRKNWNADCHLMQATHAAGSAAYLAFGAGDLIPLRLQSSFLIDKRSPAHLYKLTYTFSDRHYDDAKTISVGNQPYVVAVSTSDTGAKQFTNVSINATAGTADLQLGQNRPLDFPNEIYVVGQASTTLISMDGVERGTGHVAHQHRRLHDARRSGPAIRAGVRARPVQQPGLPDPGGLELPRARPGRRARHHGRPGPDRHVRAGRHGEPRAGAGRQAQAQRAAVLRRLIHADDHGRHAR